MMINMELVQKAEQFLMDTFQESPYLRQHPEELNYRLEHSYRVANIGRQIAQAEGLDPTAMVIACLLHDISYCREMTTREERMDHGRVSAQIARPFLEAIELSRELVNDILYGIAIHVDDTADFAWRRSPFAETVGDADNIDRFDAYRIYETLEYSGFSKLSLEEKTRQVDSTLQRLAGFRDMKLGTQTAVALWQEKIDDYISFYQKLKLQLENSCSIRP